MITIVPITTDSTKNTHTHKNVLLPCTCVVTLVKLIQWYFPFILSLWHIRSITSEHSEKTLNAGDSKMEYWSQNYDGITETGNLFQD